MPILSDQKKYRPSIAARVLAWCYDQLGKSLPAASKVSRAEGNCGPSDAEILDMPRYCYDASLLFRRMTLLQIDRDEFARDEPLLLRELQGLCALCGSKGKCIRDLTRECETGDRQDWHEYCPNAATLNALGALQNCPRAAQYLKTARSTDCLSGL